MTQTPPHNSRDELEQLVDDRDFFDAFLHSRVAQAVQLDDAVTVQIKENLDLARKSLELQPELERLRNETSDLFKEACELQQRAHVLAQAQQETYRVKNVSFFPQNVVGIL